MGWRIRPNLERRLLLFSMQQWFALAILALKISIPIFVVAGMAAGHFLGGPRPADRIALAIATPARHPGLAVAIAQSNYPERSRLVAGAVVICLILRLLLLVPFVRRQPPLVNEV